MKKIGKHRLYRGDCLKVLKKLPDNSIDSIVTDPPYGLRFMAKKWDHDVPQVSVWKECLRVLKPGGYLLAFAGTRTQHRMAVNIEDAGFDIVDMLSWIYGQGMPKSLDIGKAIDAKLLHGGSSSKQIKLANLSRPGKGRERKNTTTNGVMGSSTGSKVTNDNPATTEALKWNGFGTSLKPACEPITLARKPLDGTYAANVLKHGVGGLNIDGCRVHTGGPKQKTAGVRTVDSEGGWGVAKGGSSYVKGTGAQWTNEGRFPSNVIHDGSEEVTSLFPDSNGSGKARSLKRASGGIYKLGMKDATCELRDAGTGSAARFFYAAKASKKDRDEGNNHITVKPRSLMRYLVRLVTPIGGKCLDPYMGSGTTGVACEEERNYKFIGIELLPEHFTICKSRVRKARRLNKEADAKHKQHDKPEAIGKKSKSGTLKLKKRKTKTLKVIRSKKRSR